MFSRIKIRSKIILILTFITILALGIMGYFSFTVGVDTLEKEAFNKLTAIREMKASQIEEYFQLISNQIITLSEDRMIIDAMKAFEETHEIISSELDLSDATLAEWESNLRGYYQDEYLSRLIPNLMQDVSVDTYWPQESNPVLMQSLYLSNSPYETGAKDSLMNPGDGSSYSAAHEIYHPIIRDYSYVFGYYDIFLVDVESGGHIVYSVFKEVDFGTSLVNGPYSDTNFGRVYRAALEAEEKDFVILMDYEPYDPSYNAPAAFIASPIFNSGEIIGVLIFQMPIDRINNIMTNNQSWEAVGLGNSGETYIIGEDFLLRNQSRFLIEDSEPYFQALEDSGVSILTIARIKNLNSTVGLQEVHTEGTVLALAGETGTAVFPDYRGISVFSAYTPLDIEGVNWVIMSELDEAEVFLSMKELQTKMAIGVVSMFAVIMLISLLFSQNLTRPILLLSETAAKLADGDLDAVSAIDSQDEIGDLSKSFELMRLSMKDLIASLEDANQNLEQKVEERTKELELATERIRIIVEIAPDAVITIDEKQIVTLFNPKAEEVFGYSANEVLGQPLTMLLPEKSRSIHPNEVNMFSQETSLARGMDTRREILGQRKDGTIFPAEAGISKAVINGKHYFTTFFRDISVRRELEQQIIKANERMQDELDIAKDIQLSMLPLLFPGFPDREDVGVFAVLDSAREVGGDFYDFYYIDEDRFCFVIGDVSGKGAPGALFMAVSKTLIKSRAMDDNSTASILTHVNEELSQNNENCMFVTLFIGILNVKTGEMLYSNAGHNPPYLLRRDGTTFRFDELHGPVLGALEGMTYTEDQITIKENDKIFLYTDGVSEAMDIEDNLYTEERLANLMTKIRDYSIKDIIETVVKDVKGHIGKAEQSDDITVLAMNYNGEIEEGAYDELVLQIKNDLEELAIVEKAFEEFSEKHQLPIEIQSKISVVLDEFLNNIVSYAYTDKLEHLIDVEIELSGNRLAIIISDDGIPFNPFGKESLEALNTPIEKRKPGGLGIHFVKSIMDDYSYNRNINKNTVSLIKILKNN